MSVLEKVFFRESKTNNKEGSYFLVEAYNSPVVET